MKRLLLGGLIALALALGVFATTDNGTALAGSDGRYSGCTYGQSCYVSWVSGFGTSIAHYYGVDQWGNQKYVQVWKYCWSKYGCNHYHYSGYDRGVVWYYVYVSGTSPTIYITNMGCQGGGGGIW